MRYPHAIWKGANDRNFTTSVHVIPRFWAVHVAQGAAGGTINWFHNPNAQVSSHFLNPKVGPIDQFASTPTGRRTPRWPSTAKCSLSSTKGSRANI
jgi:hypothetical protein